MNRDRRYDNWNAEDNRRSYGREEDWNGRMSDRGEFRREDWRGGADDRDRWNQSHYHGQTRDMRHDQGHSRDRDFENNNDWSPYPTGRDRSYSEQRDRDYQREFLTRDHSNGESGYRGGREASSGYGGFGNPGGMAGYGGWTAGFGTTGYRAGGWPYSQTGSDRHQGGQGYGHTGYGSQPAIQPGYESRFSHYDSNSSGYGTSRDYQRSGHDNNEGIMHRMSEGVQRMGESIRHAFERGPHFGKGPKGYKRSDDRIREEVSECIARQGFIDASDVEVRVNNGEVTLCGTVQQREEKRRLEQMIEDLPGVVDVKNELKVSRSESARTGSPTTPGASSTVTGNSTNDETLRNRTARS